MTISRRKFVTGLAALVATPAVIRYSGIMPVNAMQASPWGTVTGLNLAGVPVTHKLWEPTTANMFMGTKQFAEMSSIHSWLVTGASSPPMAREARPKLLDNETVDRIIADRILKQEQQRKKWLNDPAWTFYGTIESKCGGNRLGFSPLNSNGDKI